MAQSDAETGQRFIEELFSMLRQHAYRDPMADAVRAARMSRAGLKEWALQVTLVVRNFTRFLSAIHSNCPHQDAQMLLAENLWEEHGRGVKGNDHYSLSVRLAESLGASGAEIVAARPLPETTRYIDHCFKLSRDCSFVEAMTGIGVGIEYFMPAFFGSLARSLQKNYGLTERDLEYLLVHVGEDEDHARRSVELIRKYAASDDERERAKAALAETLAVKRQYAEALYAHCVNAG